MRFEFPIHSFKTLLHRRNDGEDGLGLSSAPDQCEVRLWHKADIDAYRVRTVPNCVCKACSSLIKLRTKAY